MARRLSPPQATLDQVEQLTSGGQGDEQIGDVLSPYLLTDEAARFLRFGSPRLFREWARRYRVPVSRRGTTLLYDKRVLAAFVNGEQWTQGRAVKVVSVHGRKSASRIA